MRLRYNTNLISKRRTYTVAEAAAVFNIHPQTVRSWLKNEELTSLEQDGCNYLIYGEHLVAFLNQKNKKHKCSLRADEFYCFKCHQGRKSKLSEVAEIKTVRRLGKHGKFQGIRTGKCEKCGSKINRFFAYNREITREIT